MCSASTLLDAHAGCKGVLRKSYCALKAFKGAKAVPPLCELCVCELTTSLLNVVQKRAVSARA